MNEDIANKTHEVWSDWMRHLFGKCKINEDGTATIPKEDVERWMRQMNTPYEDLSEEEKQSDRDVFKKYYQELVEGEILMAEHRMYDKYAKNI